MNTEGLYADKKTKTFTEELKTVTAKLDQQVVSPVGRYLSTFAMFFGLYWLYRFYQCPIAKIEISESFLQKNYAMDYGSEVAFLCFGFLFFLWVMTLAMYLARWIWNLAEAYFKHWLSNHLNFLLRYLVLVMIMYVSLDDIPLIKTKVITYQMEISVMFKTVAYKTQNRAHNFSNFVDAVKSGDIQVNPSR